jgi:hypothetical protein
MTTTIDLNEIRSAPKSKNDSFESLVVQLFIAIRKPPNGSSLVVHRGDGGDGGVEAFYRLPSGAVLGVQAKYFFGLDNARLAQVDESLRTALENHPTLSEYWVYVPFNLTGRVAAGKRGVSEAERFENWKKKVELEAATRGSRLDIRLCSATEIASQLNQIDPHGGMRRYWFDSKILTPAQIERGLNLAKVFAGPRYSEVLDVLTNAHTGLDYFGGIRSVEMWRREALAPELSNLHYLLESGSLALDILAPAKKNQALRLLYELADILGSITTVEAATDVLRDVPPKLEELRPILDEAREVQEEAFYHAHGKNKDTPGFRQFEAEYNVSFPAADLDWSRDLVTLCDNLAEVINSQELGALTAHSLLMVGPASIGKTHAILSAAYRRFAKGGMSLVAFGDDFRGIEPWEVLRTKLGLGADVGRESLFESLQALAVHSGLPFVIFIDALNEDPRMEGWKSKLPQLIEECKHYSGIKLCVSTRDTYKHLVVDSRFDGFTLEHIGFAGREFEAVQAFAAYFDLDSEITPGFAPEAANPLFLRLACQALKGEGRRTLDLARPGFNSLLDSLLRHSDSLVRSRLGYRNPNNLVRTAMLALADVLTNRLPSERTWGTCTSTLRSIVGSEITPEALLAELAHEGLIILSPWNSNSHVVRMGYQRFGDTLRAASLVEHCMVSGRLDTASLAARLAAFGDDYAGLLEVLAATLPELTGVEITAAELGLPAERSCRLLIEAIPWRSRESVTSKIYDEVRGALAIPGLWPTVYSTLFAISMVPEHPLNALNWLDDFLREKRMVERDAFLTVALSQSFDGNGPVRSLINSALRADVARWPAESRLLAAISLAWMTSCSDRRIRDMAAKGLVRVLGSQPGLCRPVVERFAMIDDDYIIECVALAVYSACLLELEDKCQYVDALDALLTYVPQTPNVLIRDPVRLLGIALGECALSTVLAARLNSYPMCVSLPENWPVAADVEDLTRLEGLPLNMEIWGNSVGPDFFRYQVEPRISDFALEEAGISYENIACWIMKQTMDFGYPGYRNIALVTDQGINKKYGAGRGREGYAERLGKKYYWIALHRLRGILSDHVPANKMHESWIRAGHLWSVDVRKTDLTDVRDIASVRQYPDEILAGPRYPFPLRAEDMKVWIRTNDLTPHEECIIRKESDGTEWVTLALFTRDTDKAPEEPTFTEVHLGVTLFYVSVLVPNERNVSIDVIKELDRTDRNFYRGYFAEYPASPVYRQLLGEFGTLAADEVVVPTEFQLSRGNEWEYDYSCEHAASKLNVPCPELIRALGLVWDRQRGWVDKAGELIAFASEIDKRSALFIKREALNRHLEVSNRRLVYRRFVNRGKFTQSHEGGAQVDINTYIDYRPDEKPDVSDEQVRPFNC